MKFRVKKSALHGYAYAPPSKSHTIRAIVLGSLADGTSRIDNPLKSLDGLAPIKACRMMGANIKIKNNKIIIKRVGGRLKTPTEVINVGNSGTSMRILTGICSLIDGQSILTGDSSVGKRPIQPLIDALNNLGAQCHIIKNNGKKLVFVKGKIKGGETKVSGITSQFTSSLLMCAPLAEKDTVITPINLQEKPYVKLTLDYLKRAGIDIQVENGYKKLYVSGGQNFKPLNMKIPGDFSSASFLLAAAAITNSCLTVKGLKMSDMQSDKRIIDILQKMGANIQINGNSVTIENADLRGIELDLNDTPDLLPILAVVGTCAKGTTKLQNVSNARIKESDRIAVMAKELSKMGARIKETNDGLIIRKSMLRGTAVHGYHDHRIVMSLAVAGLIATGETIVDTAEAVDVTFPNFMDVLQRVGANITKEGDA